MENDLVGLTAGDEEKFYYVIWTGERYIIHDWSRWCLWKEKELETVNVTHLAIWIFAVAWRVWPKEGIEGHCWLIDGPSHLKTWRVIEECFTWSKLGWNKKDAHRADDDYSQPTVGPRTPRIRVSRQSTSTISAGYVYRPPKWHVATFETVNHGEINHPRSNRANAQLGPQLLTS